MTIAKQPLGITDVVLRDAHQSILATRVRLEDMLPIACAMLEQGKTVAVDKAEPVYLRNNVAWKKLLGRE